MHKVDISILIPVYNSDLSLRELVVRINEVFQNILMSYEIVFINDGSPNPKTHSMLMELFDNHKDIVRCFELRRNFGRPAALMCGFTQCKGEYIIMMDDDLQHDPEYIPEFLKQKEHDVVIASFKNKKHNFFKRITSDIKGWFDYKLIGKPRHIRNSSYKMIKQSVIVSINRMNVTSPFISGLLFYVTRDIINIEIEHRKRKHGKTGFTLKKMSQQFFNLLFNNSSFLLKVVSYTGIMFSIIGFVLSMYYLIRYFTARTIIQGWTSLIILNLITSGLILFSLGVFGEYFIRIIHLTEKRPSYVIKNKMEKNPD